MSYINNFPAAFSPSVDVALDKRLVVADKDAADQTWLNTCYIGMSFFNQADGAMYLVKATDKTQAGLVTEALASASAGQQFTEKTFEIESGTGTFAIPNGTVKMHVKMIGGGASSANKGTSLDYDTVNHGNSGNSAEVIYTGAQLSLLGTSVAYAVGSGGESVTGNGVDGLPGQPTLFAGLSVTGGAATGNGAVVIRNDNSALNQATLPTVVADPTVIVSQFVGSSNKISILNTSGGFAGQIDPTVATPFGGYVSAIDAALGDANPDNADVWLGEASGLGGAGAITASNPASDVATSHPGNKGKIIITCLVQSFAVSDDVVTEHNLAASYLQNDTVFKDNKIYQANEDIPAGTEFATGNAGLTWRVVLDAGNVSFIKETRTPLRTDGQNYLASLINGMVWVNQVTGHRYIASDVTATSAKWSRILTEDDEQVVALHMESKIAEVQTGIGIKQGQVISGGLADTHNFFVPGDGVYHVTNTINVSIIDDNLEGGCVLAVKDIANDVWVDGLSVGYINENGSSSGTTDVVTISGIARLKAGTEYAMGIRATFGSFSNLTDILLTTIPTQGCGLHITQLPSELKLSAKFDRYGIFAKRDPLPADNFESQEYLVRNSQLWVNTETGSRFVCHNDGMVDGPGTEADWRRLLTSSDLPGYAGFVNTVIPADAAADVELALNDQLASPTFTAERAGKYRLTSEITVSNFDVATASSRVVKLQYNIDNAPAANAKTASLIIQQADIADTGDKRIFLDDFVECAAGDVVTIGVTEVTANAIYYTANTSSMLVQEAPTGSYVPVSADSFGIVAGRDPLQSDNSGSNPDIKIGQQWTNSITGDIFRCVNGVSGKWEQWLSLENLPGGRELRSFGITDNLFFNNTISVGDTVISKEFVSPEEGRFQLTIEGAFNRSTTSETGDAKFVVCIKKNGNLLVSRGHTSSPTRTVALNGSASSAVSFTFDVELEVGDIITAEIDGEIVTSSGTISSWGSSATAIEIPSSVYVPVEAKGFGIVLPRDPEETDTNASDANIKLGQWWTNSASGESFKCLDPVNGVWEKFVTASQLPGGNEIVYAEITAPSVGQGAVSVSDVYDVTKDGSYNISVDTGSASFNCTLIEVLVNDVVVQSFYRYSSRDISQAATLTLKAGDKFKFRVTPTLMTNASPTAINSSNELFVVPNLTGNVTYIDANGLRRFTNPSASGSYSQAGTLSGSVLYSAVACTMAKPQWYRVLRGTTMSEASYSSPSQNHVIASAKFDNVVEMVDTDAYPNIYILKDDRRTVYTISTNTAAISFPRDYGNTIYKMVAMQGVGTLLLTDDGLKSLPLRTGVSITAPEPWTDVVVPDFVGQVVAIGHWNKSNGGAMEAIAVNSFGAVYTVSGTSMTFAPTTHRMPTSQIFPSMYIVMCDNSLYYGGSTAYYHHIDPQPLTANNNVSIAKIQKSTEATYIPVDVSTFGIEAPRDPLPTDDKDSTTYLNIRRGQTWKNTVTGDRFDCSDDTAGSAKWRKRIYEDELPGFFKPDILASSSDSVQYDVDVTFQKLWSNDYTVPRSGRYLLSVNGYVSSTRTVAFIGVLQISINGAVNGNSSIFTTGAALGFTNVELKFEVDLNAGDVLSPKIRSGVVGAVLKTGSLWKLSLAPVAQGYYVPAEFKAFGIETSRDPLPTDDSNSTDYAIAKGQQWTNTNTNGQFDCVDATPGAAVWRKKLYLDELPGGNELLTFTKQLGSSGNSVTIPSDFLDSSKYIATKTGKFMINYTAFVRFSNNTRWQFNGYITKNGTKVPGTEMSLTTTGGTYTVTIPMDLVVGDELELYFDIPGSVSLTHDSQYAGTFTLFELPNASYVPTSVSGFGIEASRDPLPTDDSNSTDFFVANGQSWRNLTTGHQFDCADATPGAAVWRRRVYLDEIPALPTANKTAMYKTRVSGGGAGTSDEQLIDLAATSVLLPEPGVFAGYSIEVFNGFAGIKLVPNGTTTERFYVNVTEPTNNPAYELPTGRLSLGPGFDGPITQTKVQVLDNMNTDSMEITYQVSSYNGTIHECYKLFITTVISDDITDPDDGNNFLDTEMVITMTRVF